MARGRCSEAGRKGLLNDFGFILRLALVSIVLINLSSPLGTMAQGPPKDYEDGTTCDHGAPEPDTVTEQSYLDSINRRGKDGAYIYYYKYYKDNQDDTFKKNCKSKQCYFSRKSFKKVCGEDKDPYPGASMPELPKNYPDNTKCETGEPEPAKRSSIHEPKIKQLVKEFGEEGALNLYYNREGKDKMFFTDKYKNNCEKEKCYFSKKSFDYICGTNPDAEKLEDGYKVPPLNNGGGGGGGGGRGKKSGSGSIQRGSIPGMILIAFLAPGFIISCLTFF